MHGKRARTGSSQRIGCIDAGTGAQKGRTGQWQEGGALEGMLRDAKGCKDMQRDAKRGRAPLNRECRTRRALGHAEAGTGTGFWVLAGTMVEPLRCVR